MSNQLKAEFHEGWRRFLHKDSTETLIYIHIGKCGGLSLWNAIKASPIIQNDFKHVHRIHVRKPPVLRNAKYLVVVRDPITRAKSAFDWRRHILVREGKQLDKFPGEYEALKHYATFNELAEELLSDGKVVHNAAEAFRSIHHLREDISFYLSNLLENIRVEQLFSVMRNERLATDMREILGVHERIHLNENPRDPRKEPELLSEKAENNLRVFLADEYVAIAKLDALQATNAGT